MQDALTLAFDITAGAAVAYLSIGFCLGLAERVAHPQPTPATPQPTPMPAPIATAAAPASSVAITPASTTTPVSTATVPPAPAAQTPADPLPGVVQPLPDLSTVPKPEPEYLPLNLNPMQPQQLDD
ncbi:hypothetical protein [Trichothermofontia sp.]